MTSTTERFAISFVLPLLIAGCQGTGGESETAADAGNPPDAQAAVADAADVRPDCSDVPIPSGSLEGLVGTSGATILQHEFNSEPTIDLIQFEFDHSGNWADGTRSIPEQQIESSAANPVALVLGLGFDTNTSTFERMFIGFGTFEVHRNLPPVAQGPFNPAEIGFFEASALGVTLQEYHYDGSGDLVVKPDGCEIPGHSLRINASYFY